MLKFKYIVYSAPALPDTGMIFPAYIHHSSMREPFPGWEPISAGFIEIKKDGKISCYGKSDSLKLSANHEDSYFFKHLVNKE